VIIPRESRNPYDQAVRALGVKIIEVNSTDELLAALSPRTAMIEVLGNHFGSAKLDLKDVAPIARKAGVPILVDAAADYLVVPNPYIALGADLVAYSGGKIIRGPQTAGLLAGRRDLVRAAWANSSPHHAIGRAAKVSKEEIVGMLRAVEVWHADRDIQADFREWESWYQHIIEQITRVAGVRGEVRAPARGGPFPTLNVSWDPERIGISAGEAGRQLLNGQPRIMSHAEGQGHSFLIRPVAMKPGDYKIVAQRLYEIFSAAQGTAKQRTAPAAPVADLSGAWDVEVEYEVGSARHMFLVTAAGNDISGSHQGWAYRGELRGSVDGDRVELRSSLPAEGTRLSYTFRGSVAGGSMSGTLDLGEYGRGRWRAQRRA
jgi:L-seryl-tRNA(Ser) seleniumtransferase